MSSLDRLFQLLPQRQLGDRYRLDRCLGDGTYGYVWKAERLSDNAIVAVKIPKAQGGKNSDLEEGRSLIEAPRHRNVIDIYWMGRVLPEKEVFAIEMEYFNSSTLSFILDARDDRFVASYRYLLGIYEQVLDGVTHLHQLGVTHGDIKPQNILVQGDHAKITDFGSSMYTQDIYARSRENGGTVLYSPPEFAGLTTRQRDGSPGIAHDIYSLGVLLYQLLTGHLPHDTLAQVVRHAPFPKPRELNSSICPNLEKVVLRCLEMKPEDRWHSVDELRNAFNKAYHVQMAFNTDRPYMVDAHQPQGDWSSRTLDLMEKEEWRSAENVASTEYKQSGDPFAFLLMIRAAFRDERYFDVLQSLEASPEMLVNETSVIGDLEYLALESYLRTERIYDAARMVDRCVERQGDLPGLLLRKASILGLMARYEESRDMLLLLNKMLPRRQAILRRLVMVYEQLRDFDQVDAFRRVVSG
ncbi:serine/threonine protein kinase [Geobacter pelophilus]|uniref:Serine/threonine protein kinase n=1 Tax=Geoanaerobacter pelophilus TaxID=60036 RepID=A0AAW4L1X4_9BACT|nr:serine/threonine-protein kinase [Geoanaerobacter pelophilus]MBT0664923.1 serine/threonine protein kinase [Geoanaerobacter pelophilus]